MTSATQFDARSSLVGAALGLIVGGAGGYVTGSANFESPVPPTPKIVRIATSAPSASATPKGAPTRVPLELARPSFAPQGEDLAIQPMLKLAGIDRPTYIDVGAHDPVANNDTFLFSATGSRGVVVAPNAAAVVQFQKARPHDTVLDGGTLSAILDEHFKSGSPDLLVTNDAASLKSIDWKKWHPKVVCAATSELAHDVAALMDKNGYAARGGSLASTLFVDVEILKKAAAGRADGGP
jgi:hypothetical protein